MSSVSFVPLKIVIICYVFNVFAKAANFIADVNRALIRNKQRVYFKSLIEASFQSTFPSSRTAVISLKSSPFSTNLTLLNSTVKYITVTYWFADNLWLLYLLSFPQQENTNHFNFQYFLREERTRFNFNNQKELTTQDQYVKFAFAWSLKAII